MSYALGNIVWYFKDQNDPEILYDGNDPCPATVVGLHDGGRADLVIMVDNDTPVSRPNVLVLLKGDEFPSAPYAVVSRP